jgi:hypothetical protein
MDNRMRRVIAAYTRQTASDERGEDHAPLGREIADNCEPSDLLGAASHVWAYLTDEPTDIGADELAHAADWYEGFAFTLLDIRRLDEVTR